MPILSLTPTLTLTRAVTLALTQTNLSPDPDQVAIPLAAFPSAARRAVQRFPENGAVGPVGPVVGAMGPVPPVVGAVGPVPPVGPVGELEPGGLVGRAGPVGPAPWVVPASPCAPPSRRPAAPLNARAKPFVQPHVCSRPPAVEAAAAAAAAAGAAAHPSPANNIRTAMRSVAPEAVGSRGCAPSGRAGGTAMGAAPPPGCAALPACQSGCDKAPGWQLALHGGAPVRASPGSPGSSHALPTARRLGLGLG